MNRAQGNGATAVPFSMALQTTKPVASRESFEAYCRSLGINPLATRQATVTEALATLLANQESAIDAAYALIASGSLKNLK